MIHEVHEKVKDRLYGNLSDNVMICKCRNIRVGQLRQCIREGNITLDALQEKLGVMEDCGFCRFRIQKMLEEELEAMASAKSKE